MNHKLIRRLSLIAVISSVLCLTCVTHASRYSPPQMDTVPLLFGVAQTGTVPAPEPNACILAQTQYTISYPGSPAKMRIDLSGDQDVDLYVRFEQRVVAEPTGIVASARSVSRLNSESIAYPRSQPPDAGTYFIAVANCGPEPASFTIKATIVNEPDTDTVDLRSGLTSGSVSASAPNACTLGQVQFRINLGVFGPCGGFDFGLINSDVPGLKLYARFGLRVTEEDGRIVADIESRTSTADERLEIFPENRGGLYYIAVRNCSTEAKNFNLNTIFGSGDVFPPVLTRAFIRGKKLFVEGFLFRDNLVIFVDGVPQKTKPDENDPTNTLVGGKAGRYIKRFGSSRLEVITPKGCRSFPLNFPRSPR